MQSSIELNACHPEHAERARRHVAVRSLARISYLALPCSFADPIGLLHVLCEVCVLRLYPNHFLGSSGIHNTRRAACLCEILGSREKIASERHRSVSVDTPRLTNKSRPRASEPQACTKIMDPATALAVAGTSSRLAATAWGLGESIFVLLKDAKTVDETLITIATQTRTVRDLCLSIAGLLQRTKPPVNHHSHSDQVFGGKAPTDVVSTIGEQLVNCERTLLFLCKHTRGIRTCNSRQTEKLWAQIKFNLRKEAIVEARAQLSLHLLTLNASLQVLSL